MKSFLEWVSILEAKGDPTRLNLHAMYSVLRDNGGVVPARVPSVDLDHLRRCLNAGLLELGGGGFLPTDKGLAAMAEFHKSLLMSNPDTPTPSWLEK